MHSGTLLKAPSSVAQDDVRHQLLLPQMVLFWTCEKYPHPKDWQVLSRGFLRLVRKLHKCVSQRLLKHYFVRKSNLLQYASSLELDALAQTLAFFLKDPQVSLP